MWLSLIYKELIQIEKENTMIPTEREIKVQQFTKKKMCVQVCVCVCVYKRLEGKSQSINKYFFVVKLLNHIMTLYVLSKMSIYLFYDQEKWKLVMLTPNKLDLIAIANLHCPLEVHICIWQISLGQHSFIHPSIHSSS